MKRDYAGRVTERSTGAKRVKGKKLQKKNIRNREKQGKDKEVNHGIEKKSETGQGRES